MVTSRSTEVKIFNLMKAITMPVICAWCPAYDRTHPANAGASHTICPACTTRMLAELDREGK